jgi:D-arginine dehydrogenase
MEVDVAVIGGGIAGLSAAAFIAPSTSVVVLEMESTLGYHSTGRSAALYTECYGAEPIRRLALASKPYFVQGAEPFGTQRGVLFVAPQGDPSAIDNFYATYSPLVPDLERLPPHAVADLIEVIGSDDTAGAVLEPRALDLDVHAILTSYATTVRNNRGTILTSARATSIDQHDGIWHIDAGNHVISATTLVNATGAWGDETAVLAGVPTIDLSPLKRSAFTFDPGIDTGSWPMIVDTSETWYMKPEGPHLLGSAASEIPQEPSDAKHDEIDIALGIMRITEATHLVIRTVKNQWAGLRTFTSDRVPAVGFDPATPGFFWLVGQGGYGIHTSPAIGQLAAGLIVDGTVPKDLSDHEITADMFDPGRLR